MPAQQACFKWCSGGLLDLGLGDESELYLLVGFKCIGHIDLVDHDVGEPIFFLGGGVFDWLEGHSWSWLADSGVSSCSFSRSPNNILALATLAPSPLIGFKASLGRPGLRVSNSPISS